MRARLEPAVLTLRMLERAYSRVSPVARYQNQFWKRWSTGATPVPVVRLAAPPPLVVRSPLTPVTASEALPSLMVKLVSWAWAWPAARTRAAAAVARVVRCWNMGGLLREGAV